MKQIKYIIILIASLFVSCTENEIVPNQQSQNTGRNQIQLVTRFAPFTEHDVTSRAVGDNQSVQYDFVIFGGDDNKCVYYNHCSNEIINIDRERDFDSIDQSLLGQCTIYVLANYSGIYNKICADALAADASDVVSYINTSIVGKVDINYFANIQTNVLLDINFEESALPRIGSISGIDLSEKANTASGTIYTVNLQSLYSKMVFDIKVEPTETNPEIFNSNTFQLIGYKVTNLPKMVDFWSGEVGVTHDEVDVYTDAIEGVLGDDVNLNPTTELSFTLYLPERFFKPTTSANDFTYPFGKGSSIREEDLGLRQRYKPLLGKGYSAYNGSYDSSKDKKATYVTISGVFTDHQGHTFDVDYDVYVGKDNYGNFDVVRNMQYNNTLTIKGIHNSSDQAGSEVSVDHRVNVTHTRPITVSLRRETLLDAHFEVRPMRIKKNSSHAGDETHVKVEVIYSDENNKPEADGSGNWISLERSFGDGKAVNTSSLYCVSGSSAGKRKYFTYDLVNKEFSKGDGKDDVEPLHNSTEVIVPIPQGAGQGECVWIYVDECTMASRAKDAMRSATIKVTCGKYVGGVFTPVGEPLNYTVSQHKLFEVNCGTRTYCIEHEEEYLYNFDNDDSYEHNQTEYNGMAWGMNGVQLSNLYPAIHLEIPSGIISIILQIFGSKSTEEIINNQLVEKGLNPKYDFYIPRDITNDKLTIRGFSGYTFNQELATYIKKESKAKIEGIALDETPQSAFAYCYNRNKRDRNGNVASQKWYMPAIDELEEIMTKSYLYFSDFHGQYYWSCQPAYEKYNMSFTLREQGFWGDWSESTKEGFFYIDNTSRSRATRVKVNETTGDFEDIISSASEVSGVQYGEIKIPYWEPQKSTFTLGNLNRNSISYDNHPGNKLRTEKCRVRAVYKP